MKAGVLRLGPKQKLFLIAVCRSNGGGVRMPPDRDEAARVQRMFDLGLVQGKDGAPWLVVHTEKGLEYFKKHYASRSYR